MDQQNSTSSDLRSGEQAFPRLSINHFLLLTLTVAFSLASAAPFLEDNLRIIEDELGAGHTWRPIVETLADSVASGMIVFGFIVLVRGWIRGQRLTTAPGHWYFLIVGPYILTSLVCAPIVNLLSFGWEAKYASELGAAHLALNAAMFLVGMLVCTIGLAQAPRLRWKVCLAILWASLACITVRSSSWVIETLWSLPSGWYHQHLLAIGGNLQLAFAVSFFIAAIIDGVSHVRRDWLHYLALATILLDSFRTVVLLGSTLVLWWSGAIHWLLG